MDYFQLLSSNKTCVLYLYGKVIYESKENGVGPFVKYVYYNGKPDNDTILIDKVIGVAVANIVLYCDLKTVYTKIISKPALDLLTKNNVQVNYQELVTNILRKDRTDICPLEKKILTTHSFKEAYDLLKQIIIDNNFIHLN